MLPPLTRASRAAGKTFSSVSLKAFAKMAKVAGRGLPALLRRQLDRLPPYTLTIAHIARISRR
jgi:hypothetical protein